MQTKALKRVLASQAVAPSSAKAITKVGFGEGGTPATPNDTGLSNAYIKRINGYQVLSDDSIQLTYSLGYNEANGKIIKEIGFYCEDGTLVAREAKDTVVKDSDTAIDGTIIIVI